MRKIYILSTLVLTILIGSTTNAQDFSNKGKDFWVGYGYHQQMLNTNPPGGQAGGSQDMVLYFAAEQAANVTVSIPGLGYSQNYFVPANSVITSSPLPKVVPDSRLNAEGLSNKGIHITSDKAIVSYAHVYNASVSGATILFPTNTLGKEYYSINYKNTSNSNNANCFFYVVAADTGTTTVRITPSGNTIGGWVANNTYVVTMTQGQVYNVMGVLTSNNNPFTAVDLTGSKIESVASANGGCKKIAVFSGSGRISITCNNNSSSSDNYMVQAFPKTAWGKKYLTVPAAGNQSFNLYRICVADPTTVVRINGVVTALPLQAGFYYEIAQTNQAQLIEADKPITVAQYFSSQGSCGNGNPGDPEVIYLSPVEQNINKVLWNATPNFNILTHFFNAVIPNTGTAVSSFRLDGAIPASPFVAHPQDPGFVYIQQSVSAGPHIIQSDSGFNSMAYGFGGAESYGYNGGTNIRDLFQFITIQNEWGTISFPATCRGTPFHFGMVFPYRPIQIQWQFGAILNGMGINDTTIYNGGAPLVEDSSWVVAGRTLYRYRLPRTYYITAVGIYPIKVIATNPTPDGCGNEQIIDFDVQVFEPPVADFTFITDGCVINPVNFFDNSNTGGRPIISRHWNFGDATTSNLSAPSHTYAAPGIYNVKYSLITDVGCLADTIIHPVEVNNLPLASFTTTTAPYCIGVPITFTDNSTASGGATINKWTWDFGDGSPVVIVLAPNPPNQIHSYAAAGTYNATLRVETTTGCPSLVFTLPVTILPDGTVTLTSATGTDNQTVCINTPIIDITYSVGGSSTGGSVSGLPAGVTGTFAGGIVTITGTPSVSGIFNYTVTTTGPCVNPTANGTITVTEDGTVTLSSAPGTDNQTVCINTPIVAITYAVGGSGNGGSVSGLPAGVTGTFAGGVITITGTPTVSGTFNYTVNTTGPCVTPSTTGTITVTPDGTITLTSAPGTDNQTVCINTPIIAITYAVGASGTGGSVSGLPAGVTGTFAGGIVTITGTPSVSGIFNYTVTTTGPCVNPTANGTITVTEDGTVTLSSAPGTDNQTVCINTPIVAITYAVGGSGNGGSVSGLPAGVTGTFAGGVITITGTPTVSGTFNYTVNTTGPCVTPSTTGTITVTPDGTITLTSAPGTNNQTVCINTPITNITYAVGASGTGGSVSGLPAGVTGTFAGGIITIAGTPTVSGTFNYTVTTTGPCVNPTANGTITVTQDGTVTLTSAPGTDNQAVCKNSPITAITYSVGGSGTGGSVIGLPAGVTGTFAGGVITITGAPSVSGTFNYTVNTTGPCVTPTATGTITVYQLPTSNFNSSAPSCETRTINFTDISVANSGNIIGWAWNFGDPPSGPSNTSTLQNPSHTFATAGVYNVTLIVTTDLGCLSIEPSRQVVIDARPLAGYIIPEVCLSDTYAQFTDTSKVALPSSIQSWLWNFGDPPSGPANTSTLQNPQHSYSATGPYLVELIVTSNTGCKDTITHTLFVNGSFPVADFSVNNPTTLCANDSVSITDASTVFPGVITKVEIYWDNIGQPAVFDIDNFPVSGEIYKHLYPNFQVPLTRNFTIRYRAYSGGVCVNDKLRIITVNAAPLVQFNPMPNICYDAAPYQITPAIASEIGGVPGNGIFTGPGVSLTGLFSPAVAGPGSHRLLYTFTSTAGGCIDTASNIITVWDTASAKIDVQPLACERNSVSFNSTNSTIPPGNGSINGWTWNFGDPASGASNTSTLQNPSHLFTGWGNYNVTLVVATSNGCRSTLQTLPVFVNPEPKPNFSTPASSCLPDASVAFGNLSTIADGTQASFSYLWNFDDPGSGANNTSTLSNPSHVYTSTGPFNVNLQVISGVGCVNNITKPLLTVHPQPLASFTVDKIDVCIGSGIAFTNTSNPLDGTITQYNWTMDDGNGQSVPTFSYTYNTVGTYNVSLFIFNSNGCRSTTYSKTVFVNPYPPVNAGPDKFMLEGGQVQLTPALNASMPVTYLWNPVTYLSDPTIAYTIASPPDDKTYTLTVTTDKGCAKSDDVFIKVLKAPAIPNIFSPNGDGIHDTWVIQYLESYPGATVDIFNRYGQLIYHSEGYANPWDGTINGKPVPVGTYYYIVTPKNGRKQISGYVDVIR
ncbi:MAG: PKD domain-containing protein [Chitinophagaceae bacterium]|nr:PKD domain-containing protein [Chitinophagaceae bacterium]